MERSRMELIKEREIRILEGTRLHDDWHWLIEQAEKANLLENQLNRFEYLAAYEYSWQVDNVKASNTRFRQGALEGMENYNRKWKEATNREIKAMW
ncbi:hypothetical protein H9636_07180 [Ureibacillus sp. Re31]|uniref:Uncharacterized protein n=1 Tax=Ureibacillus galli TaxID=2762222 RepID=A0ABR8XAV0_9BACL|nr:hypothetical protein [Ureibacillus galli]MBD8026440.1 hypothetical protein [Ureibacillus galli]